MLIPCTPAPSPTLGNVPLSEEAGPPPRSQGWGPRYDPVLARSARVDGVNSPYLQEILHPAAVPQAYASHQSLLHPLLANPPADLFLPLPPVTVVVGQLRAQEPLSAPGEINPNCPPAAPPKQHPGLSRDGYMHDADTAQFPTAPGINLELSVHQHLPNISLFRGAPHPCTFFQHKKHHGAVGHRRTRAAKQVQHNVLICEVCLKVLDDKSSALVHAHVHGPPHLYFCGQCKDSFTSPAARELHWLRYGGCREVHDARVRATAVEVIRNWHKNMLENESPMTV